VVVAFRADLDVMTDLAARMDQVSQALAGEDHGSVDSSVLGGGDAAGALDHFVANWSHGRSEIIDGIKTVRQALAGASANYRGSDQGMAAKL
jgi:uncharacterized protein YukE